MTVLSFLFITAEFTVSQDLKQVLLDRYYPIDFIGLDFSEVKLIGVSSDYASAYEVKRRFFPAETYRDLSFPTDIVEC